LAVLVNRVLVPEGQINLESAFVEAGSIEAKRAEAARRLALRELLRQRAKALGIDTRGRLEEAIDELLAREVPVREADGETCRRYFEANRERFHTPVEVELRHILLAAAPWDAGARTAARDAAEALIAVLDGAPEQFAELAARHSRCASAQAGGRLGMIGRGQTVPELERVVLRLPVGLAPRPVESRYGFHVVEVLARRGGEPLAYGDVRRLIAEYLRERAWRRALAQYLQVLAAGADIEGVDLAGAEGPLVQ